MPDKGDLRKEGFARAHGLRTTWQEHGAAGYFAFPVRTQKEVTAHTRQASFLYSLCFLFSPGPRWFCPQLGRVFLPQLTSGKALADVPSAVSLDSPDPLRLTVKAIALGDSFHLCLRVMVCTIRGSVCKACICLTHYSGTSVLRMPASLSSRLAPF